MHNISFARRLLSAIVLLCLVCATPIALGAETAERRCSASVSEPDACNQADDRFAAKVSHLDIDKLPGTASVPIRRATRVWLIDSLSSAATSGASLWLRSPAHDPPRTIRFCTLII
jgi:hypothetical protein